jgi:hypothetical protein
MWNSRANDSYLFLLFVNLKGTKGLKAVQLPAKEKMVGRFISHFLVYLFSGTIGDNG